MFADVIKIYDSFREFFCYEKYSFLPQNHWNRPEIEVTDTNY